MVYNLIATQFVTECGHVIVSEGGHFLLQIYAVCVLSCCARHSYIDTHFIYTQSFAWNPHIAFF